MRKFGIFALGVLLFGGVQASWYWPFGSDEDGEKPKRVSELVEPASLLIEEASDKAAEGKTDEAVECYRKALSELDRIELENPDRAKSTEFATIRNKRAYVNAAIDSLLLNQVKANAKVVAVSDTTELEKRLERERWGQRVDKALAALDRRNSSAALEELEKALAGTTNAVLIALTHCTAAGACAQMGSFKEARRALSESRRALARAGTLTDEERRLVTESLQTLRTSVVDRCAKAFDDGRRVCDGNAKLGTMDDLTSSDAVATAGSVVASLSDLQERVSVFAFPEAENLTQVSSNLLLRASVLRERMASGEGKQIWEIRVSDLEAALRSFEVMSREVKGVDAEISSIEKTLGIRKEKPKAPETEKISEPSKPSKLSKLSKPSKSSKPSKLSKPSKPPKPSKLSKPSNRPLSKREQILGALENGDFSTAERLIGDMLVEKPNGAAALNLKAALETRQGKLKEAEATLDQAIMSNPRSHFAYYNMANLMLQVRPDDKSAAKRYYETGRAFGGPVDAGLEEAFK